MLNFEFDTFRCLQKYIRYVAEQNEMDELRFFVDEWEDWFYKWGEMGCVMCMYEAEFFVLL